MYFFLNEYTFKYSYNSLCVKILLLFLQFLPPIPCATAIVHSMLRLSIQYNVIVIALNSLSFSIITTKK